jgi:hypothetical protein
MSNRFVRLSFALAFALGAAACSKSSNPAEPSATAAAIGAEALTASIAAPRPLAPANNIQVRNADQPVTLVVRNAVSTKSGLTYTFEVATDSAFAVIRRSSSSAFGSSTWPSSTGGGTSF